MPTATAHRRLDVSPHAPVQRPARIPSLHGPLRGHRRLRHRRPGRGRRRGRSSRAGTPSSSITVGDNNYPSGAAATIDANIGQYYHDFIGPYTGAYGAGRDREPLLPVRSATTTGYTPGAAAVPRLLHAARATSATTTSCAGRCTSSRSTATRTSPTASRASSVQAHVAAARARGLARRRSTSSTSTTRRTRRREHGSTRDAAVALPRVGRRRSCSPATTTRTSASCVDGFPYVVNGLGRHTPCTASRRPVAGSEARFNARPRRACWSRPTTRRRHAALRHAARSRDRHVHARPDAGTTIRRRRSSRAGSTLEVPATTGRTRARPGAQSASTTRRWAAGPAQLGYGDGDEATVVSFGPDPERQVHHDLLPARVPRSPIRRVLRGSRSSSCATTARVVYLNGVEVVRSNMPAGAIDCTRRLASRRVGGADESAFFGADVADRRCSSRARTCSRSRSTSRAATSSDISFDLRLVGDARAARALVAARSDLEVPRRRRRSRARAWKDRRASTTRRGPAGPAQLGYGDGDEATVVGFGPDPNAQVHHDLVPAQRSAVDEPGAVPRARPAPAARRRRGRLPERHRGLPRRTCPTPGDSRRSLAAFDGRRARTRATFVETRHRPAPPRRRHQRARGRGPPVERTSSDVSFDLELVGL